MTTREYQIGWEFNLPKVIETANKLAARATKKGLSGGYQITTRTQTKANASTGQMEETTYVVITGEPVKYDGWSFVAKVEYVNGQPVVTGSPWYSGQQVDRTALRANACDHCGIGIARKYSIVVEDEAGSRKQVGSSCVKDFLGAEVNGSWFSDKDPFDALVGYAGSGISMESLTVTLAQAATAIRVAGFVPTYKSDYQQTTAQVVRLLKGLGSQEYVAVIRAEFGPVTPEDSEMAARAREFGRTMEGDSDYAMNVRAVFDSDEDWINPKFIGLAASVIGVMLREDGKKTEAKADIADEVFAADKTKITISDATVTGVYGYDSQWGSGQIIVLVGRGYRFKWNTSTSPGLEVGDVIDFAATVKGRDEYNGQVSTAVVRLKVTKEAVAA
jgi:hypothetical protein